MVRTQNNFLRRLVFFGIATVAIFAVFVIAQHVHAQTATDFVQPGNLGLTQVQQTSGVGTNSFGAIIGKIIKIILTIVGVLALILCIYGGFLWMTAGGSEEAVDKAKKTLVNGAIGLVIVLMSYTITSFIISAVGGATGTDVSGIVGGSGGSGNENIPGGGGGFGGGSGATAFAVKSISPQGKANFANIKVVAVLTTAADAASVNESTFVVTGPAGAVAGKRIVDGDVITFVPSAPCPAPNGSITCFEPNAQYTVTLKSGIVAGVTKKSLTCAGASCSASFTAGAGVDKETPTISNFSPHDAEKIPVDSVVPIQALVRDTNSIAFARIIVDGSTVETFGLAATKNGLQQELAILTKKFNTKNDTVKKEHTITVYAEDVAGNKVTAVSHVSVAPLTCFNKIKDGDELDVDCSVVGGACGQCTNLACTDSKQCSNGAFCDVGTKKCVSAPVINDVQPTDGAIGTFVSITGQGFGTGIGEVVFMGDVTTDKDDVVAALACDKGWSSTQIVAVVPANAKNGPIRIKNGAGATDVTTDSDGMNLPAFKITDVQRPGLCTVTPSVGDGGKTLVSITGSDSLSSQPNADRKLLFGGYVADSPKWGDGASNVVTANLPKMEPGKIEIAVIIKGLASNPIEFQVAPLPPTDPSLAPITISKIDPTKGGVGQYITIQGAGFGITPNKVYFVSLDKDGKQTGLQIPADFSFPAQCAKNFWSEALIVAKVPNVPPGDYGILVSAYGKKKFSNLVKFLVTTDVAGPQVCAMLPSVGPADGKLIVTFYGERFGTTPGGAIFSDKRLGPAAAFGGSWGQNSASVIVPADAVTGDVRIALPADKNAIPLDICQKKPELCSNAVKFTVGDCRVNKSVCSSGLLCCADGSCGATCGKAEPLTASFAWCFSTGDSCEASKQPTVVESCADSAKGVPGIPSPSPAIFWPKGGTGVACTNAMLSVLFTEPIDPQSVSVNEGSRSSLFVEECTATEGDPCSSVDAQPIKLSSVKVIGKADGVNTGLFAIPQDLKPKTTYRVTLSGSITGFNSGLPLIAPPAGNSGNLCKPTGQGVYCYTFTTNEAVPCKVTAVGVSPSIYVADNLGVIRDPLLLGAAKLWLPLPYPSDTCQILDPSLYPWRWTPAKSTDTSADIAISLNPDTAQTPFFAKQKTDEKLPITLTVTELNSKAVGKAALAINPGPPIIYESCVVDGIRSPTPTRGWTGGDNVCPKALVAVEFDQPVVSKQPGTAADGLINFKLWKCDGIKAGHECETTSPVDVSLELQDLTVTQSGKTDESGKKLPPPPPRYQYVLTPKQVLALSTNYLVEIATTTKGVGLGAKTIASMGSCRPGIAYCYTFKTAADLEGCKVQTVEIDPFDWLALDYGVQKKLSLLNGKGELEVNQEWHAKPFGPDPCVLIKNDDPWIWAYDSAKHPGYIEIDEENEYSDNGDKQAISAKVETASKSPVTVFASTQKVQGKAYMTIQFPSPTIEGYNPTSCSGGEVCLNAFLGATFSTNMRVDSFKNAVYLYKCPIDDAHTKNCDYDVAEIKSKGTPLSVKPVVLTTTQSVTDKDGKIEKKTVVETSYKQLQFTLPSESSLQASTTYRIAIVDGPVSEAYKKFIGHNYPVEKPAAFSWTFVTAQGVCGVDHVKVTPTDATAKAEGVVGNFYAQPFGAPDSCHPEGQYLNADDYKWTWKIGNEKVAAFANVPLSTSSTQPLKMIGKDVVVNNVQSTKVTATAASKTGNATWKLECNAPPVACPVGTFSGIDHCCHVPPKMNIVYPHAGDQNVCLNTLILADVNDNLDIGSITTSTVRLGFEIESAADCANGAVLDGYCYDVIPYNPKLLNDLPDSNDNLHATLQISLDEMLPEHARIRVKIQRDPATEPKAKPVLTSQGVPVDGVTWDFTSGSQPCQITSVGTSPTSALFQSLDNQQLMAAYGLSQQGGLAVPVSPIKDKYDWSWKWLSTKSTIAKFDGPITKDASVIIPGGKNGQTYVTPVATILNDLYFGSKNSKVGGSAKVTATLCDDPWYAEKDGGLGASMSYYNFDFWYCRTEGNNLLPKVEATYEDLSDKSFTTQEAMHLSDTTAPEANGAIGIRIESNLQHYSPAEWYLQKEFKGQPDKITVDGFDAVRIGNTTYIGFGTKSSSSQYTNIMVIGLSSPASPELQKIYDQIISNLQFTTNLSDVGLCYLGGTATDTQCASDFECVDVGQTTIVDTESQFCRDDGFCWIKVDSSKTDKACKTNDDCAITKVSSAGASQCKVDQSRFIRDMIRVTHAAAISRALEKAKVFSGGKYPIVAQGTFVPGLVSSKWGGWNSFMQQLGILTVQDPLNQYVCANGNNPDTCWNSVTNKYECAAGSSVYHYKQMNNGQAYQLGISLEQDPQAQKLWNQPVPFIAGADAQGVSTNFCTGSSYTAAAVCGDGAVGGAEQCDPAGSKLTVQDSSCPYGERAVTCSDSCSYSPQQCINKCGDGIVQGSEKCDEGVKFNGKYNHCSATCGVDNNVLGSCGDGVKQPNEMCEIRSAQGAVFMGQELGSLALHSAIRCNKNAQGNYEVFAYALRTDGTGYVTNREISFSEQNYFDDSYKDYFDELCATAPTKLGKCKNNPLFSCTVDGSCPTLSLSVNDTCIFNSQETKYSFHKADSCNWDCKNYGSYCGDNIVNKEMGEQCDGDKSGVTATGAACIYNCTTSCAWESNSETPTCTPIDNKVLAAGCGDGQIDKSSGEECDAGTACKPTDNPQTVACIQGGLNGVACTPQYGTSNSCQYCTTQCKKTFISGAYCGDGKVNGPEFCDKSDLSLLCPKDKFDYGTAVCKSDCTGNDVAKGGSCVDCAVNSAKLTASKTVSNTAKKLALTFVDPSLGWLPGNSAVRAYFVRKSATGVETKIQIPSFNTSYSSVNGLAENYINSKGLVAQTFESTFDITASDSGSCTTNGNYYSVSILHHPDQTGTNLYAENKTLQQAGGIFNYSVANQAISPEDFTAGKTDISVWPAGQEGDYRFVWSGPPETTLTMLLMKKKNQDEIRIPLKDQLFGSPEIGYLVVAKTYNSVSGACANDDNMKADPINPNGKQTIIAYNDQDIRTRVSGCLSDIPFVEAGYTYAFTNSDGTLPLNQRVQQDGSFRQIVGMRKADKDGYYNVAYQIIVSASQPFKKAEYKLQAYYYDGKRWAGVGKIEFDPMSDGAYRDMAGVSFWYPFYFLQTAPKVYSPMKSIKPGKYE